MPFNNPLVTFMKIFRTGGQLAMWLKSGANSVGEGSAVIQFYTGAPGEKAPGEITATGTGGPGTSLYELVITSPSGLNASVPSARYQVRLQSTDDSGLGWQNILSLFGDSTWFRPPVGSLAAANSHKTYMGTVRAVDSSLPVVMGGASDHFNFTNPPDLGTNSTDISALLSGGASQRPGSFVSTVEKLGNGHALIAIHGQNASGATIANGSTIITGGSIPAWARTNAGETANVPLMGELIGAVAGSSPLASIDATGAVKIFGAAIPTGRFFSIVGVYRSAGL